MCCCLFFVYLFFVFFVRVVEFGFLGLVED